MSEFQAYLTLGFEHISDVNGYDHILFIVALCAIYKPSDWKKLLILVTAFTIGHSVTLALSAFRLVQIPSEIIEFLIPVTIFITAFLNVLLKKEQGSDAPKLGERPGTSSGKVMYNYILALGFGFIHGMGFSNYFSALMGKEENIVTPLLAFNLGLEVGQILIVVVMMVVASICFGLFRVKIREWNLFISGAAAGIALTLMQATAFWID